MELLRTIEMKGGSGGELFEGELESHIEGMSMKFDKCSREKFMDISVDISGCDTLIDSLRQFVHKDELVGENAYDHDEYGKQDAYKYHVFSRLPAVLILNLKRYSYNVNKGGFDKVNDKFVYENQLDMS